MTFVQEGETIIQTCHSFPSSPLLVRPTKVSTRAAPGSSSHFKSATPLELGQPPFVLRGMGAEEEKKKQTKTKKVYRKQTERS